MTTVAMHILSWGVGATPKRLAQDRGGACPRSVYQFYVIEAWHGPCACRGGSLHVSATRATRAEGGMTMLDVLYIGLALGFLALSWGLVELCDRL